MALTFWILAFAATDRSALAPLLYLRPWAFVFATLFSVGTGVELAGELWIWRRDKKKSHAAAAFIKRQEQRFEARLRALENVSQEERQILKRFVDSQMKYLNIEPKLAQHAHRLEKADVLGRGGSDDRKGPIFVIADNALLHLNAHPELLTETGQPANKAG